MRGRWGNLNPSRFPPLSASHRTPGKQAGIWPALRLSGNLASICCGHWNMLKSFPGIPGFKSLQTRVKTLRWLSTSRTWNDHVARTQLWLIPVPREGVIWNQLRSTPQHPSLEGNECEVWMARKSSKACDFPRSKSYVIYLVAVGHLWGISFGKGKTILHSGVKILC